MFRLRRFRSSAVRKAHQDRLIKTVSIWSAVAVLSVILLAQISMLPYTRIDFVTFTGIESVDRGDALDVVREAISGRYLFLFLKRNILLYPRGAIERALLEEFPRIKSVDADIFGFKEIQINITERESTGIVCIEDKSCHYIDELGFIFADAPVFSATRDFIFREEDRKRFLISSYFVPTRVFIEVLSLRDALVGLDLSIMELRTSGRKTEDFARHFTFTLDEGTELIFSVNPEEFEIEIQNLQAILASTEFEEESEGDIGNIEYIDLRFGNKVFYRLSENNE